MICIIVIVNNVFKILLRVVSLFTVNYLKFKLLFSVLLNLSVCCKVSLSIDNGFPIFNFLSGLPMNIAEHNNNC